VAPDRERRGRAQRKRSAATALILHLYRELIAFRARPSARARRVAAARRARGLLAYERRAAGSRALVALNFTGEPQASGLPPARVLRGLSTRHGATLPGDAAKLELAPSEGAVLVVDD
jgi:hypothetical protein